jgi:hypothetical protein
MDSLIEEPVPPSLQARGRQLSTKEERFKRFCGDHMVSITDVEEISRPRMSTLGIRGARNSTLRRSSIGTRRPCTPIIVRCERLERPGRPVASLSPRPCLQADSSQSEMAGSAAWRFARA